MKGIAVAAAAGLLIASFVCPGTTRAQQLEPDAKGPKLTIKSVEAQVVTLQAQVAALHPQDFAVVDSTGDLVRGSSSTVSANALVTTGHYQVIFNKDVSGCAYVATIGDTDASVATPGEISVASRSSNVDGVYVETEDSTGADSARPFHLSVLCP